MMCSGLWGWACSAGRWEKERISWMTGICKFSWVCGVRCGCGGCVVGLNCLDLPIEGKCLGVFRVTSDGRPGRERRARVCPHALMPWQECQWQRPLLTRLSGLEALSLPPQLAALSPPLLSLVACAAQPVARTWIWMGCCRSCTPSTAANQRASQPRDAWHACFTSAPPSRSPAPLETGTGDSVPLSHVRSCFRLARGG
jgi:hypothetical protein